VTSQHVAAARRNAGVLGATAVALGLLFLYPTSTNSGGGHRRPGQALAAAGVVAPTVSPTGGTDAAGRVLVVNGTSVDTRYGPVQVQVHVQARRILSAAAIDYPRGGGRDRQINSYAVPILERETVNAQSAQIDAISGATYTSDGYRRSLQAALDASPAG